MPCEGRPPIRRAWTIVPDFELLWRGTSTLETSLWLAAQRDHKFCAVARLRTQRLVRYNQGGSWRHLLCNKIEQVLGNCDPIERCFRAFQVAHGWPDIPLVFLAYGATWIVSATAGTSATQRHQAPSYMGACAFHCGEDIRPDWTVGVPHSDRDLQYGLKGLADIKALGLTANKDRHRREVVGGSCVPPRSQRRARDPPQRPLPERLSLHRASVAARICSPPIGPRVRRSARSLLP